MLPATYLESAEKDEDRNSKTLNQSRRGVSAFVRLDLCGGRNNEWRACTCCDDRYSGGMTNKDGTFDAVITGNEGGTPIREIEEDEKRGKGEEKLTHMGGG